MNFAVGNPNFYFGDPAIIGTAAVEANQQAYVIGAANTLASKIASVQANNNIDYVIVTKLSESFGTPALKQQLRADYNAAIKGQLDSLNVQYAWADLNSGGRMGTGSFFTQKSGRSPIEFMSFSNQPALVPA